MYAHRQQGYPDKCHGSYKKCPHIQLDPIGKTLQPCTRRPPAQGYGDGHRNEDKPNKVLSQQQTQVMHFCPQYLPYPYFFGTLTDQEGSKGKQAHYRNGNSGNGEKVNDFLKPHVRSKKLFKVFIQKGIADGKIGVNALPSLFNCRNGLL